MANARISITQLVTWKVLNVSPHRSRGSQYTSGYRPQVREPNHAYYDFEPEIRHLGRRKSRLSLESRSHDADVGQSLKIDQQTASWLFKLPKEVRLMIYEEVLGGMIFHIVRRKTRLGHKLCKGSGDPEQCISDNCRGFKTESGVHTGRGNGGLIQILQSCRKM